MACLRQESKNCVVNQALLRIHRWQITASLGNVTAGGCLVAATLSNVTTGLVFGAAILGLLAAARLHIDNAARVIGCATGKLSRTTIRRSLVCDRASAQEYADR
jgi:hypothetical protein